MAAAEYVPLLLASCTNLPIQQPTLSTPKPKATENSTNTSPATYQYNIPKCIPNGEYLLRIQSLAIHNPGAVPQFYVSCAQLNVTGGGNSNPSPTVKIPGAFKATDPGYTANVSSLVDDRDFVEHYLSRTAR